MNCRSALLPLTMLVCSSLYAAPSANEVWQALQSSDGSSVRARHETSGVALDGKIYVIGGRHTRSLRVFDTVSKTWSNLADLPMELHHFQPVAVGHKIYAIGAMTCCYPDEPGVDTIYVYDTMSDVWSETGKVPASRVRGGAGAALHDGWIYVIGGNELGHSGGARPWFDRYDPTTGSWEQLPDALTARDHFQAGIVDGKIVAAGGRQTTYPYPAGDTLKAVDVYDIDTGDWSSASEIPTERGGTVAVSYQREVIVLGGEIDTQNDAFDTTEAYDVDTDSWRTLQPMITKRHGAAAAIVGSTLHVMAGSREQGGRPETDLHETLDLDGEGNNDRDDDGLTNSDETALHGTNPDDPDSDDDGLRDGDEIAAGTSPLMADSDSDGLDDAEEGIRNTDPLLADSDDDGLLDGAEVDTHGTDPLLSDSDNDGLSDGSEVDTHGTDPLQADTDGDRLGDGAEINTHATDPLLRDSDGDGMDDGDEIDAGTDPTSIDGSGSATTGGSTSGAVTSGESDTGSTDGTTGESTTGDTAGSTDGIDAGQSDVDSDSGETGGQSTGQASTTSDTDDAVDNGTTASPARRSGSGSLSSSLLAGLAGIALFGRRRQPKRTSRQR